MEPQKPAYRYQVGGTLGANAPYVDRPADETLYTQLQAGEFCYVFNCRQMGKSSLRAKTMRRLMAKGIGCVSVDLTAIGTQVSTEQWYADVIESLHDSVRLLLETGQLGDTNSLDLDDWQQQYEALKQNHAVSPVRRLHRYLKELLLSCLPNQTFVIFIDEIDNVLNLEFDASDFFALIRACFNQRADDPDYERLTFALFGVATPAQLIRDVNKTPFNLGKDVVLTGFELERSLILAEGFAPTVPDADAVLKEILAWTGGQPFLTQKLCDLVQMGESERPLVAGEEATWVAELVRSRILDNWEAQDQPQHLKTIRDRILPNRDDPLKNIRAGRLLGLYQQILKTGEVIADESEDQAELCLSGLVVRQGESLKAYNRIYTAVFNQDWVTQELANLRPDYYVKSFNSWLASDRQDAACLLQEQELLKALEWSAGKRLSNDDYQFLAACQDFERQRLNKEFEETKRKTQRQIRVGLGILGVSILVASIAWMIAFDRTVKADQATQQQKVAESTARSATQRQQQAESDKERVQREAKMAKAQEQVARRGLSAANTKLISINQDLQQKEQTLQTATQDLQVAKQSTRSAKQQAEQAKQEVNKVRQTQATAEANVKTAKRTLAAAEVRLLSATSKQSLLEGQGFQALLQALRAGQQLKQLDKSVWRVDSTQMRVVAALQQAVYGVRERNWFSNGEGVYQALLSPDGKTIAVTTRNGKTIKLWSRDGQLLKTLEGHEDGVISIAFSPDGKILASTGSLPRTRDPKSGKAVLRGNIKLWSRDGRLLKTLNDSASQVVFSPDGQTIASARSDVISGSDGIIADFKGTVKLWSRNGQELRTLRGHSKSLLNISFSPDGKTISSADRDGNVKLWSLDGRELQSFQIDRSRSQAGFREDGVLKYFSYTSLTFSPDSQTIAVTADYDFWVSDNSILQLFSRDGKKLQTIRGQMSTGNFGQTPPSAIAFSPDGQMIASGSPDGAIKLWNRNGQELLTIKAHQGMVYSLSFSQDGQTIVSGGADGAIRFWDLTKRKWNSFSWPFAQSPDWQLFATHSEDGAIKLWNQSGKELRTFKAHQPPTWPLAFSPDGQILASASKEIIKLWSRDGQELKTLKVRQKDLSGIEFSLDSQLFITRSRWNSSFTVWSREGQELQHFEGLEFRAVFNPDSQDSSQYNLIKAVNQSEQKRQSLKTYPTAVKHVTFGPDSQIIVVGDDGTIKWFNRDGEKLKTFTTDSKGFDVSGGDRVAFSPDKQLFMLRSGGILTVWNLEGQELYKLEKTTGFILSSDSQISDGQIVISGGEDGTINLWNRKQRSLKTLKAHQSSISCMAFSPDGQIFASSDKNGTIKLWNRDGQELKTLKAHQSSVCIQFSPDGQVFASGSEREITKLWSRDGRELQTLGLQTSFVFSPDSQIIATGGEDGFIRLWSRDGKELQTFKASQNAVKCIQFSPDGKMFESCDGDAVKLWSLDLETLMAQGCDWLRDYLQTNPNASESDRQLCGITKRNKRAMSERYNRG